MQDYELIILPHHGDAGRLNLLGAEHFMPKPVKQILDFSNEFVESPKQNSQAKTEPKIDYAGKDYLKAMISHALQVVKGQLLHQKRYEQMLLSIWEDSANFPRKKKKATRKKLWPMLVRAKYVKDFNLGSELMSDRDFITLSEAILES